MSALTPPSTVELADEIAGLLEREGPHPCDDIAIKMRRLRTTVLHTLRDDPRFVVSGRGRATRWRLADQTGRSDDETGNAATNGADGTDGPEPLRWSWDPPETSACTDPAGHRGNNAHITSPEAWAGLCVVCDGQILAPPVTFREWVRREGGEERLQQFENDYRDYLAGRATAEQVERVRFAFADERSVLDEEDA